MTDRGIRIALSIPADEALARIEARGLYVKSFLFCFDAVWNAPKEKDVIVAGKGDNGFVMRKRHWYSNGLQPILEGRIEPADGGSVLTAQFRRLKFVEFIVWTIFICEAIAGFYTIFTCADMVAFSSRYESILQGETCLLTGKILLGSAGFILFINFFARWLGDRDRPHLRAFLEACFSDVRRS